MRIAISIVLAIVIAVGAYYTGTTIKKNDMEKEEIRNLLMSQNQSLTKISDSIEHKFPQEYIKGLVETFHYNGLHFSYFSNANGFIQYCLQELEKKEWTDLLAKIKEGLAITEKIKFNTGAKETEAGLQDWNAFLDQFPSPAAK
ncbi:hypothetical protein [Paenibacillus sp. GCM10027626]|uniref:hypothetical protein n=1 Tax=Paenibacillus sp. GCM10027626 TaxID=3273411 RepID=UPI00362EEF5B